MSIEKLKSETLRLRKERSELAPFAQMVLSRANDFAKERDALKPEVTDDDAIKAVRQALKKSEETLNLLKEDTDAYVRTGAEVHFLNSILPEQTSAESIQAVVVGILPTLSEPKKAIGVLMKALGEKFGNSLDRKLANEIIQREIAKVTAPKE